MNAPDRDTQLARRIYRLPLAYKTVILQLISKCEDLRTSECIERHLHNANSIINSCSSDAGYQKLPKVKTKYYFIEKQTNAKLTIEQMARKFNKSTKTIYYWVYTKYHKLLSNYEVVRE
ncbi:MAG: hypothetical protein KBD37_05510 [Burkholderiales bacterium]|nr:hypothetical protein [Burkholderiales bacterium]